MKRLFLLSLFIVMGSILSIAQARYGFGMTVVSNFSADTLVSKEIFISSVIDLDSILCVKSNSQRKNLRKNKIYFMCVSEWFMDIIKKTHPESLLSDSEISMLHQVERVPDSPNVKPERLQRQIKELDSLKVSKFMDRFVAEKRRSQLLNNAYKDVYGRVILIK